jgi:hypothetical protein
MTDIHLTSKYSSALRRLETLTGDTLSLVITESERRFSIVELVGNAGRISMGSGVIPTEAAEVAISRAAMAAISASGKRSS